MHTRKQKGLWSARKRGYRGRYLAKGFSAKDWWDNYQNYSTRQVLKRDTRRQWEEAV